MWLFLKSSKADLTPCCLTKDQSSLHCARVSCVSTRGECWCGGFLYGRLSMRCKKGQAWEATCKVQFPAKPRQRPEVTCTMIQRPYACTSTNTPMIWSATGSSLPFLSNPRQRVNRSPRKIRDITRQECLFLSVKKRFANNAINSELFMTYVYEPIMISKTKIVPHLFDRFWQLSSKRYGF